MKKKREVPGLSWGGVRAVLCAAAAAVMLCGCGGRGGMAAHPSELNCSGGAVNATGAAVSGGAAAVEHRERSTVASILYHHNQRNVYRFADGEDMEIEMLTFSGELLQRIELPVRGPGEYELESIERVSDSEILYLLNWESSEEYDEHYELWSLPLGREGDRDLPRPEDAKKLFEQENWFCVLYADDDVISYEISGGGYKEYDLRSGRVCSVDSASPKQEYCLPCDGGAAGSWCGENELRYVLLAKIISDDEYPEGLYAHRVGSGSVEKIADNYANRHGGPVFISDGDRIYYTGTNKTWDERNASWDIWCYDGTTGKSEVLYTEEELEKVCPGIENITRLYLNGGELWIDENIRCPLSGEGKPKEATPALQNYIRKIEDKKDNIGGVMVYDIQDDICFFEELVRSREDDEEEEEIYHFYDFRNGRELPVDQKEMERTFSDWFEQVSSRYPRKCQKVRRG